MLYLLKLTKISLYLDLIHKQTKHDLRDTDIKATLYYYSDENKKLWRLVYLVESHSQKINFLPKSEFVQEIVDYVIDAYTDQLVSQIPCIRA
ncbi:hypothetical protein NIES4071_25020 [Calothrix sp. NIES-4071]|nr:hypothetical protein NIES4071_25020 [Calothrix sp. NIES-4071]BAZ56825.1 hypothetical protein NIES4105_24960 [Calothrix sp. NIES-4105]